MSVCAPVVFFICFVSYCAVFLLFPKNCNLSIFFITLPKEYNGKVGSFKILRNTAYFLTQFRKKSIALLAVGWFNTQLFCAKFNSNFPSSFLTHLTLSASLHQQNGF